LGKWKWPAVKFSGGFPSLIPEIASQADPHMRLVAVSVVKNEADIIEPFVRHTSVWVDHHFIFDHDSTDGTRQKLCALKDEGLRVSLFTDDALGNLQQARSNQLTRLAAETHGADWILPLDADEILTGPGRGFLEQYLAGLAVDCPAIIPLLNYCPTEQDDASIDNPVLRLRYCQPQLSQTKKILVPRALALDGAISAGKGSHAVYRGGHALREQPLPEEFHLAHLALRSPQHQVLRVVLAELQKLSRGSSHAGLDEHYRLGFQLLSEDPELFFRTLYMPCSALRLQPIPYLGAPTRYDRQGEGWGRVAQALLPFLEKLATSHGRLVDASQESATDTGKDHTPALREFQPTDFPRESLSSPVSAFVGFTALSGWGPQEGPVPQAFLPPFHWGYGPETQLTIKADKPGQARLVADVLTYVTNQRVIIELNGVAVTQHDFERVNQKEPLIALLPLQVGTNHLTLKYTQALTTPMDPRRLAVIFLTLRVHT
jgi:Glycosyl transferase family 2